MMKLWSVVLALALVMAGQEAEAARRLGGGQSIGRQSSNVTQREAASPAPATPASPSVAPAGAASSVAKPAPAPAPAAVQAPRRPWGAMLGGLAAGLGLAWLAHSLGFGEAFGQILMVALLAMVAMAVIGWFMRSRRGAAAASGPYAFQGAGSAAAAPAGRQSGGALIGTALGGSQSWGIPAGFDTEGFLGAAKRNFVALQAAWDRSDIPTLRAMMTDGMLDEIRVQLNEREAHRPGQQNKTDVVMIEAQLLGIEDLGEGYMASVEFSGMIREEPSAGPNPFREVWNMTKPKDGSAGWLVAGVQALQ